MIDISKILDELKVLPDYDTQISLQGTSTDDDHSHGTGKLNTLGDYDESDFSIFLFNIPYTNSIIKRLGMFRTRVMRMKSKTCYSYHRDLTKRIHIPLITNDKCFMVIDDEVIRYPANNNYYIMDTTKIHTAVNASWEERIHIVGCIT